MSELELLREAYEVGYVDGQNNPNGYSSKEQRDSRVASLLSQQAEPVEPAPAQDEQEAFDAWYATEEAFAAGDSNGWYGIARAAWMARADRPAQTEQQPVAVPESWWQLIHDTLRIYRMGTLDDGYGGGYPLIDAMTADGQPVSGGIEECTYLADAIWNALRAAPIAQTAPQPERWHAMSADWKETSVAIHGERSGYIACGIPEDKAHAIIKAHNIGLPEECAAKEG